MDKRISFIDLAAQQQRIRPNIDAAISRVLDHGQYIMGPEVRELEDCLAAYVGVRHCVTAASGTDALLMALMAYGVGPGDAVFTTPFTFVATAEVIALLGATPVFVDIDPQTFNLDPLLLEEAVSAVVRGQRDGETPTLTARGIIPVDLFGLPADYDAINAIARNYGLFVLEDAAQGFGGEYRGRKAGALGDVTATSFFPAKPLGCYGDGGALLTDHDDIAEKLRSIRVHGQGQNKYNNIRIGINGRLDTIQAAVLLEKMKIFPEELELRQRVAARYDSGLANLSPPGFRRPVVPVEIKSAWALYTVTCHCREQLKLGLEQRGIPTAVYYERPLHLLEAMKKFNYSTGMFPYAEEVSTQVLSLPMSPYLTEDDQDSIIQGVLELMEDAD